MKKIILLNLVILLNLFLIGCVESTVYLNKNNEKLKNIDKEKLENIVDEYSLYVIDEIYVADTKIVGFSTDSMHGVFVYEKDNSSNFPHHFRSQAGFSTVVIYIKSSETA